MKNTNLLAIGDSSACFFSGFLPYGGTVEHPGVGDVQRFAGQGGFDCVPGIKTSWVGPIRVGDLKLKNTEFRGREKIFSEIQDAITQGFTGWILLCGGHLDLGDDVSFQLKEVGVLKAVQNLAIAYIDFVHELKKLYPRIAIWGPAVVPRSKSTSIRAESLNISSSLFTKILQNLAEPDVPFFSVLEMTIDVNGNSIKEALHIDRLHLSPKFLPYVVTKIAKRLRINIGGGAYGLAVEKDITKECVFENTIIDKRLWLVGRIDQSIYHIKRIVLGGPISYRKGQFALHHTLGTIDRGGFDRPQPWLEASVQEAFEINLDETKELRIDINRVI